MTKSWNTRTGSAELSTVTALLSRMRSVRPATVASTTAGADAAMSARWCSPTPYTDSPTCSARTASSTTWRSRSPGETPASVTSANVVIPSSMRRILPHADAPVATSGRRADDA